MRNSLKVGDRVERTMVIVKKIRRDFSGGKFLLFQFSDSDGILKGVWWDPTEEAERSYGVNDVVHVRGEITEYQGALQLKVSSLTRLEQGDYDPSLFLPSSKRDPEEMYDAILETISSMTDERLKELLERIFNGDRFKESFIGAPAAKGWHHSYVGGLAEHVHDMIKLALRAAEVYPEVNRDLLLAGILLHDIGKMKELSVTNHISYSDGGRLVGHIVLGVEMLDGYLGEMDGFPEELGMKLKHMILSHHGSLEHGSPVLPMTVESMLLHYLDNMDAQVRGVLMVLGKDGGDGSWTEYVKLLDRFIYRGGNDG
jgi:3'-5' exoribonuclease